MRTLGVELNPTRVRSINNKRVSTAKMSPCIFKVHKTGGLLLHRAALESDFSRWILLPAAVGAASAGAAPQYDQR